MVKLKKIKQNSKNGPKELPTDILLPQNAFCKKYGIKKKDYVETGLEWNKLHEIFMDYLALKNKLEHPTAAIVSVLMSKEAKDQGVHSVRYRIKDPNSLIEKVIRKTFTNKHINITLRNYKVKITDLIGIRILHTFKYDWYPIHNFILKTFTLKPDLPPLLYYKEGDEENFIKLCKKMKCKPAKHPKGYRSVHYIVSTQLTKDIHYAEIQVRTIFEEGWSEIDHKIRYSYKGHSKSPFEDHLRALNTACGNADEIGTIIKNLEQKEQERILELKSVDRK